MLFSGGRLFRDLIDGARHRMHQGALPVHARSDNDPKESAMTKIVAGLFLSLDGVVEAPETWTTAYMDEEVRREAGAPMAESDMLLLGRVTYQTFAAAFTGDKASDPFAARMNSIPKYVVSTTLDQAGWQNSTLIGADLAGEIRELRAAPGKGIAISGSPTLVRSLLQLGLVDELRLLVFPLVVGAGRRFFEEDLGALPLELRGSKILSSGVAVLSYGPASRV
jgi:dihydrofolate reductase